MTKLSKRAATALERSLAALRESAKPATQQDICEFDSDADYDLDSYVAGFRACERRLGIGEE